MWNPVDNENYDFVGNGLRTKSRNLKPNCGIGAGGFQKGNTCAKDDGRSSSLEEELEDRASSAHQLKREEWLESRRIKGPLDAMRRARELGNMARLGERLPTGPQRKEWDKAVELSKMLGADTDDATLEKDEFGSKVTSRIQWDRIKNNQGTREAAYDVIAKAQDLGFEKVDDVVDKDEGEGVRTGRASLVNRNGIALLLRWAHGGRSDDDGIADNHPESQYGELTYKISYPSKQQQEVYKKSREWSDEAIKLGEQEIGKNVQEAADYAALGEREKAKTAYARGFEILRRREAEEKNASTHKRSFFGRIKDFFVSAWNWITGKGWTVNYDAGITGNNCGTGPNGFEGGNDCGGYKPVTGTDDLPPRKKARKPKYPKVRTARVGSAEGMSRIDEYRGARSVRKSKKYVPVDNNCGIGKGGFEQGNKCGKGGGGGVTGALAAVADKVTSVTTKAGALLARGLGGKKGAEFADALEGKEPQPKDEMEDRKKELKQGIAKVSAWVASGKAKHPEAFYKARIAKAQAEIAEIEAEQARRAGSR